MESALELTPAEKEAAAIIARRLRQRKLEVEVVIIQTGVFAKPIQKVQPSLLLISHLW
jgi:metal-dependent amidase/aminoacylase/carboxypeptidase family protein